MLYQTLLTFSAFVDVIFGLASIFIPVPLFAIYNVEINAGGAYIAQILGGALLSFGVLNWLGRSLGSAQARQAIVLTNLVSDTAGFVISLITMLKGETGSSALGWSTVAIYFLLAVGFAYTLFASQKGPGTAAARG